MIKYDGNTKYNIQIRDSRSKERDNPKLYSRYYLSRRDMRKDMLTMIFGFFGRHRSEAIE